jgi:hypothetical protein
MVTSVDLSFQLTAISHQDENKLFYIVLLAADCWKLTADSCI